MPLASTSTAAEVEKPAVVIVHKLRRHVFEEFMRWLNCTGEYPPSRVSSTHHRPREECAAVSSLCVSVHHRVYAAHSVSLSSRAGFVTVHR